METRGFVVKKQGRILFRSPRESECWRWLEEHHPVSVHQAFKDGYEITGAPRTEERVIKIRYELNPDEAPGCILIRNDQDSRTVLIQLDYDYPGLASAFGWAPCCDATDGTVDCSHKTAREHIRNAYDFLVKHEGEEVEDPGYFNE